TEIEERRELMRDGGRAGSAGVGGTQGQPAEFCQEQHTAVFTERRPPGQEGPAPHHLAQHHTTPRHTAPHTHTPPHRTAPLWCTRSDRPLKQKLWGARASEASHLI